MMIRPFKENTMLRCAREVSKNALDSLPVNVLGVLHELANLINTISNVRHGKSGDNTICQTKLLP